MDPAYFAGADEWRAWLAEHHDTAPELWVGFHKKASSRPSITWPGGSSGRSRRGISGPRPGGPSARRRRTKAAAGPA